MSAPLKRSPEAQRRLAGIREHLDAGRLADAAREAASLAIRLKRDPEVLFLRALIAERQRDLPAALRHASASVELVPHPEAFMIVSRVLRARGDTDAALSACDRALGLRPGALPYLVHRAATLEEAGRFADARSTVDPLIADLERRGQPIPAPLRLELAKLLVQEKNYGSAVEIVDALLGEASSPAEFDRLALYLKAKALDRSGAYAEAFEAASRANEIGRVEFDPALYEKQVGLLIQNWSADRIARFPITSCRDESPVFIAGMPRSGTSLIDQIIDAHPLASGVGELSMIEAFSAALSRAYNPDLEPPRCFGPVGVHAWNRAAREYLEHVRRIAPPGSLRIVNKALGNNKLVGLLARLFPRTRIIHAVRDPRDVAISCYMGGFNNRLHPWTTRLGWAACAWEQSQRLMDHWKSVLDVPILDVSYERLVHEPDREFPRLIEFLGLEWHPACLEFYRQRRTVRTLSYDQVNRPLYTGSAGRHANYADQIGSVPFPDYAPS